MRSFVILCSSFTTSDVFEYKTCYLRKIRDLLFDRPLIVTMEKYIPYKQAIVVILFSEKNTSRARRDISSLTLLYSKMCANVLKYLLPSPNFYIIFVHRNKCILFHCSHCAHLHKRHLFTPHEISSRLMSILYK